MLEALCKHVQTFALVFFWNMADLPLAPVSHLTRWAPGDDMFLELPKLIQDALIGRLDTIHLQNEILGKTNASGWLGLGLCWERLRKKPAVFFQSLGGFLHMLRSFREDGNKHWQSLTVTLSVSAVKTSLLYSALLLFFKSCSCRHSQSCSIRRMMRIRGFNPIVATAK
jgi:hypothetical protein